MRHEKTPDLSDRRIRAVTWLGLISNLGLAIFKGIAGTLANSSAMIADSAHSFSDVLTDGVTLGAIHLSRLPKDKNHPYGHGKFETLGALFIAIILVMTGVGIALQAFQQVEQPTIPGNLALWAAILSILVKEGLFQITVVVGKQAKSRIVIANAWNHRSDAVSSIAALLGIGAAQLGFPLLDPVAGILVAGLIVKTGIDLGYESIRELADETVETELLTSLEQILLTIAGVEKYHEIRARKMGTHILVDLHVQVDKMMSVSAAHQVAERVRLKISQELPEVDEVLVHIDAEDDADLNTAILMRPQTEIAADIHKIAERLPEIQGISHIHCHFLNQKLSVQIEIIVNPDLRVYEVQQLAENLRKEVLQIQDIDSADIHLELEKMPLSSQNPDTPASDTVCIKIAS